MGTGSTETREEAGQTPEAEDEHGAQGRQAQGRKEEEVMMRYAVEYWPKSKNSGWYPTRSYDTPELAESAANRLRNKPEIKEVRVRLTEKPLPAAGDAKMKRYAYKYPRTSWEDFQKNWPKNKMWRNRAKAIAHIEYAMRPGYTSEPYMQLIEVEGDSIQVVAECTQSGWVSPLEAAGFVGRD